MKVEKLKEEKLLREYSVTVPANDIELKITDKLAAIGKTAKVPGFRPGKIPTEVLRKKYIKDIMGEVLQDVVTETSAQTLNDNKVKPALQPEINITEFDEGKDLKYTMSVEIMPDMPEVDLSKINVTKFNPEVSEKDVDELQKNLLSSQKTFNKVDRAAKDGDAVVMDFKGFVGDEAFAGGEAKGHQLELGSGQFIPGFEEQLVGKKAGDETKVSVKFPDEYHSEDLKGKDAVFEVTIHEVKEAGEAEATDEFAKTVGFESLEKLREMIKSQIESDGENMSRVLVKKEVFDNLDEKFEFDLPGKMVEQERQAIVQQIKGHGGEEHDAESCDNPDHDHRSDEEIIEEYGYLADRRVKLGLLVTDIGVKNEIKVTQEEVNQAIIQEARRFPGQEQQVFEYFKNNPQQQEALKGPIIEDKVVDIILEKADVKTESKTLDEIKEMLESNKDENTSSKKEETSKKKVAKKDNKKSTTTKKKTNK